MSQSKLQPSGCPFPGVSKGAGVGQSLPHPPRRRFGRPPDPAVREEIALLDARRDCQRIVFLLTAYEFPFDMLRATELALFHTYGSRSVSQLLDRTHEFTRRGQKRYDDTRLLIAQFMECGWDDEIGSRAIEQMNHIHSFFKIPNDDFLFVLWTFIDFPIRWMDDFGWRAFTPHESEAWFNYWCEVGRHMGMRNIPPDRAAYDAFVAGYEAREFVPAEASQRVAQATVDVMAAWLPRLLRPLVRPVVRALVRPQLLPVLGYKPAPSWLKALVHATLKLRARVKRYVSLERHPTLLADKPSITYGEGGAPIEALGPEYAHRHQARRDS